MSDIRFNNWYHQSGTGGVTQTGIGSVGIGITTPSAPLEIADDSITVTKITSLGDDSAIRTTRLDFNFSDGGGAAIAAKRAAGVANTETYLSIRTGGSTNDDEKLRIESNGNVGIGTDNPDALLHVLNNSGTPGGDLQRWTADLGTNIRSATLIAPEVDNINSPFTFSTGSSWNFRVDTIDALTIDQLGNVGIRTSSPEQLLDVRGGAFGNNQNFGIQLGVPSGEWKSGLKIKSDDSGVPRLALDVMSDNTGGNTEVLSLRGGGSVGNVGINTTTPTETLQVAGTVTATKFWERNANPDYQTSGVTMENGKIRATGNNTTGAVIGNTNTSGYNSMISFVGGSTSSGYGSIEANSSAGPRFVAPSDRRMKTNIRPAESQFELFKQLQFYNYTMDYPELIEDPIHDCLGMIADEVQQVMPELVTGEPNAVDENGNPEYQTVGYTGLVPHSIAAIKELILKVEELQARLDAAGL